MKNSPAAVHPPARPQCHQVPDYSCTCAPTCVVAGLPACCACACRVPKCRRTRTPGGMTAAEWLKQRKELQAQKAAQQQSPPQQQQEVRQQHQSLPPPPQQQQQGVRQQQEQQQQQRGGDGATADAKAGA
ncbi:hypothetical protein ABPG77_000916 [Micractinium sp. CCAP 211/92]